jgi:hypothetical protein
MSEIERRRLDELAVEIRHDIEAADHHWQSAVKHAIRAGEGLIAAKALVKHGEWLPWLAANFRGFSERSASNYMRLARNSNAVADLPSIRQAVALLTEPKPEPELPEPEPDLPPEPNREDFGDDEFAEWRYLCEKVEHGRDCQIARYERAIELCTQMLPFLPFPGAPPLERVTALMARAATGLVYERAQRDAEFADEDEAEEKEDAAYQAWLAHRAACEAHEALKALKKDVEAAR